jgi:hypothetical protein
MKIDNRNGGIYGLISSTRICGNELTNFEIDIYALGEEP